MQKGLNLVHLIVFLCFGVFAWSTFSIASQKDGLLKVYFLDVGQGDGIFIETPNGNQVLVDGGPDSKIVQELAEVMPFYDREIDLVVVSHPHADHITGLVEVLERYDVGNILEAKEFYNSPVFNVWQKAQEEEGAKLIEAGVGMEVDLGNGVRLKVIYPDKSYKGVLLSKPHQANVVLKLSYKNFELLLTGDMEKSIESELIDRGIDVRADILKVGHHGSKTSSLENFLRTVQPQLAFIQVGQKNLYRHPSPEITQRLENFGIKYYRTDLDGHMKVATDGETIKVNKY